MLATARVLALTMILLVPGAARADIAAVFVSGNGDDVANDCATPETACRTLNGALGKVITDGVIHVFPGSYGSMTINKSVQVIADGGQASIVTAPGACGGVDAGICVTAPASLVLIRGFIIDQTTLGAPPYFPKAGIRFLSGAALHIENCTIVNTFHQSGIEFVPSGSSEVYVSDTVISDN